MRGKFKKPIAKKLNYYKSAERNADYRRIRRGTNPETSSGEVLDLGREVIVVKRE